MVLGNLGHKYEQDNEFFVFLYIWRGSGCYVCPVLASTVHFLIIVR
jgi:hypothetical protein